MEEVVVFQGDGLRDVVVDAEVGGVAPHRGDLIDVQAGDHGVDADPGAVVLAGGDKGVDAFDDVLPAVLALRVRPRAHRTGRLGKGFRAGEGDAYAEVLVRVAEADEPPRRVAELLEEGGEVLGEQGVLAAGSVYEAASSTEEAPGL